MSEHVLTAPPPPSQQRRRVEVWKWVGWCAGYMVSTHGRLRTERRRNGLPGICRPWRIVGGSVRKKSGYVFVALSPAPGRTVHVQLHRLVLEAFRGPCPEGMETRHLNGMKTDNRLPNLCWGTPVENTADRIRHGTHARGEAHANAKLTAELVRLMRAWRAGGMTWRQVAEAAGVSESTARAACEGDGRNWRHVV